MALDLLDIICIQMKWEELAKTFMMISNRNFCLPGFLQSYFGVIRVDGETIHFSARILVQVTIYRRLLIGRDGHLDQPMIYRNLYENTGPDSPLNDNII